MTSFPIEEKILDDKFTVAVAVEAATYFSTKVLFTPVTVGMAPPGYINHLIILLPRNSSANSTCLFDILNQCGDCRKLKKRVPGEANIPIGSTN